MSFTGTRACSARSTASTRHCVISQRNLDRGKPHSDCAILKLANFRIRRMSAFTNANEQLKWPVAKVRSTFIDYFVKKRNHTFWPSSPVVPLNDPTLLFANSGMAQFKSLFLGTCDPTSPMAPLKMVANSQKCIRAGGKHNDLEDVGKDVYHHTFFEMLGNWSFGQYFKQDAIAWAWECLTEDFGLNKERLYATYFQGDEKSGVPPDNEARDLWLQFLPPSRVLPFGMKENFWEMGPTGPCGPCSEIHYDRIGNRDASHLVNADVPDVIEIWNNVFMQYNREADQTLKSLPAKHVDTGMGLERLTSILQDKQSNYDTDVFMPIFGVLQEICKCPPYEGRVGKDDTDLKDMAYRVVADHIRTVSFAITDGAVPSSEGRGYVIRRILRRAVRYGQELLNAPAGFFTKLVPVVVENFSGFFPELLARKDYVMQVISEEEASFNRTLDQGVKHFRKVVAALKQSNQNVIPGRDAHILFSSMGFPLDLTQLMAAEIGFTVDVAGFNDLMDQDRKLSETAEALRKGVVTKDMTMEAEQTAWLQSRNIPTTDSEGKYVWHQTPTAKVLALFTGRGGATAGFADSVQHSSTSEVDNLIGVVLDKTPFYYESGGQIFDTGCLKLNNNAVLNVRDTQTYGGYVVHVGYLEPSSGFKVGDSITCHVDYARRSLIAPNHTMTHVLNFAIRKVLLGEDAIGSAGGSTNMCDQKGSLVDPDKLRFDFSWNGALTTAQLDEIEKIVQEIIKQSVGVYAEKVSLQKAFDIFGLRAIFGEHYPDPVRVLSVGQSVADIMTNPKDAKWAGYSVEFCGGTHLTNTSQAEDFVIVEESGIAKGIRRITGFTSKAAKESRVDAQRLMNRLDEMIKMPAGPELQSKFKAIKIEIDQAVVSLVTKDQMRLKQTQILDSLKKWYKANEKTRLSDAITAAEAIGKSAAEKSQKVLVTSMEFGADGKIAQKVRETIAKECSGISTFLVSADDDGEKVGIFIVVANYNDNNLNANDWLQFVLGKIGKGRGGGKIDMANGNIPLAPSDNASDVVNQVLHCAKEYQTSKGL